MTRPDTDETPIYTALTKETAAKEALEQFEEDVEARNG